MGTMETTLRTMGTMRTMPATMGTMKRLMGKGEKTAVRQQQDDDKMIHPHHCCEPLLTGWIMDQERKQE